MGGPWDRFLERDELQAEGSAAPSPRPSPPNGGEGEFRVGTVRYPRVVPRDAECAKLLKKRTLTNLYNERLTWLDLAHQSLDAAVFAAYGWDPGMRDEDLLAALLELNLSRARG